MLWIRMGCRGEEEAMDRKGGACHGSTEGTEPHRWEGAHPPVVFVRADYKGVTGGVSVRAESKGLICTKIVQVRGAVQLRGTAIPGVCVRAAGKGLTRQGVCKSGRERTYKAG